MPTKNPRVNVTLPPSLDSLLGRMATLQRASKSQVLRELLEAAEPGLQRAVALMDAASKASQSMKERIGQSLGAAQDQAEKELSVQMAHLDSMTQDLVSAAQAVRARRPARKAIAFSPVAGGTRSRAPVKVAAKRADPPASKRGVKSPRRGAKS